MQPRFLIIGAGMAGILGAIRLKQLGLDDFAIYEKADRLGGTWRENTYPGVACDVPSHLYSYSFAHNPGWTRRFAEGPEIQAYFEEVAHRYGVAERVRHGREIVRCERIDGRWQITAADGSTDEGDVVIGATGVLHHPRYPDITGIDSFAGPRFHSARWDHSVALEGRRVGIIGNGSSAVQIFGAIVDRVAELSLFQRTPQWIAPIENPAFSAVEREEFARHPEAIEELRANISFAFTEGFSNHLANLESPQLQGIHDMCVAHLENSVRDPELRERLRPDYRAGCKRLVMSENFYDAIQHPNARLVTAPIERIEPTGIRTRDEALHELDVLVLATGFQVDSFLRPMQVIGDHGVRLDDRWRDGPFAYMAITIPDFPNLFLLNGPNGPVGNFSLIEVAELQLGYILQLVERIRTGECRQVGVHAAAMDRFDRERREAAKLTIWNSGCRSWYLDDSGVPTAWPWTFDRFRDEMSRPRLGDYDLR